MNIETKIELAIKIISSLITAAGILIGVWQFNLAQKNMQQKELEQRQFEAIAKFKDMQLVKYTEATGIISNIIHTDNYQSDEFKKNLKKFWQLYWVELSAVESAKVEAEMVKLGNYIGVLEKKNFEGVSEEEKKKLYSLGYDVAQAIKESSRNWGLPERLGR